MPAPAKPTAVSHVVLQQLDPLAFAMRAEKCAARRTMSQNIKDLKTAIRLDPKCAHAHCLLAKIYVVTGQADLADDVGAPLAKSNRKTPRINCYAAARAKC